MEKLLSELQEGANIFIDDSQHFCQFQRMFESFEIKLGLTNWRRLFPERILWITLDWSQFIVNGPLISRKFAIPRWLFPDAVQRLDITMRNTRQIMKLAFDIQSRILLLFNTLKVEDSSILKGEIGIELEQQEEQVFERQEEAPNVEAQSRKSSRVKIDVSERQVNEVFSREAHEGHRIGGPEIQLLTWKRRGTHRNELLPLQKAAIEFAIKDLYREEILYPPKTAIIYSASLSGIYFKLEPKEFGHFHLKNSFGNIRKFFTFETSSQEFKTVIFVIYVPADFAILVQSKITILSQIYEGISRAQTQLIIISDPVSIERLTTVMPDFGKMPKCDIVCEMDSLF